MTDSARKIWSRGEILLCLTMLAAILLSVGGIAYAVRYGVAADGGRGGALALALTFLMFFLGPDTAAKVLEGELPATGDPKKDAALVVARVRNSLSALLDWASKEKIYLSVASVTGTIAWGFGDIIARCLGAPPS